MYRNQTSHFIILAFVEKKNRYHISGINMFALKTTISLQSKKKDNNSIKVIFLRR